MMAVGCILQDWFFTTVGSGSLASGMIEDSIDNKIEDVNRVSTEI